MKLLIEFLIWALASIGMAHIMVDGTILVPFKNWLGLKESKNILMNWFINLSLIKWGREKLLSLLNCYQCSGFWAGVVIGLLVYPLNLPLLFCYGCAGSYLSSKAALLMVWIQTKVGA